MKTKLLHNALCAFVLAGVCSCSHFTGRSIKVESKTQYLIDVRSQEEYSKGHLEGAVLIPHTEIEQKIQSVVPDKESSVAVYCRSGRRSGIAKEAMERMGYKNIENLGGMGEASEKLSVPIVHCECQ